MDESELLKYWREKVNITPIDERRAPNLSKPKLDNLLKEREKHRGALFNFACYMTIASFYLLAGVVIIQIVERVYKDMRFEVLDHFGLEILAVSVFGQILGVIYIIANSLWSGKEFDILKSDK